MSIKKKLFVSINLASMIPKNHILVKIDKIVDFTFIRELTQTKYCKNNGRPSIDPEVFFRMQIISYLYGIKSDRQLCEQIYLNIAFRWFCKFNLEDQIPDHSSLTRIRDRLGEETFKEIFNKFIIQWKQAGIVKGEKLIADASLVEANASINSMIEKPSGDSEARILRNYEKRYNDFHEGKKQRKYSNQTHVSQSDPDAKLVARKGYYRKLSYKVHYTIDGQSRIITDCHGTPGSHHECPILPHRIKYQLNTFKFPVKEVIADKGYGRGPTYSFFKAQGIRSYIPIHNDNMGKGRLSSQEFKYDKKQDLYICPQGKFLYPYEKKDRNIKRYRVVGGHCKSCLLKASCLPQRHQMRSRFMYRNPYQDEINRIKMRQNTIHFKKKLIERKWKIEGLFAEAKVHHSLRRVKYRGLPKVQIQFYMTAMVQNFKRLVADGYPLQLNLTHFLRSLLFSHRPIV